MSIILDGKALSVIGKEILKKRIAKEMIQVGLAVIQVGENPASTVYVGHKIKACADVGIHSIKHNLPADVTQDHLIDIIKSLNNNDKINGILVQLPLPAHLNTDDILMTIAPKKDVDGLHTENAGKVFLGETKGLVPCTPMGCMMLLDHYLADMPLRGLHAVIVGRSRLVGRPIASLLLQRDCTVTVAHSATHDLPDLLKQADIVVAAVGKAGFISPKWLKNGAVVLDVGINRLLDKTLVGDVDLFGDLSHLRAYTPVPGGVGPMTVMCLLLNTYRAYCLQNNIVFIPVL